jgi:hypothetical protein
MYNRGGPVEEACGALYLHTLLECMLQSSTCLINSTDIHANDHMLLTKWAI